MAEQDAQPTSEPTDKQAAAEEMATDSGAVEPDLAAAQGEIDALQQQLAAAKEDVLRAQAEMQNVRRRAERDVEQAHKFGLEKLIRELLPVADNLERAIEASQQDGAELHAVREGVELTLKSFQDSLARQQVEAIEPTGQPFDPELHQAMSMVESTEAAPNTVLHCVQKGYQLHGRLVRPAMVVVAKAPSGDDGGPDAQPHIDEQA